jgi:hypothetical protein
MNAEASDRWKLFIHSPYVANVTHHGRMSDLLLKRPAIMKDDRLAFPHPDSLKRAALLADRIYMPCFADANCLEDIPVELTFGDPRLDVEFYSSAWMYNEVDWPWKLEDPARKAEELLKIWLRDPLTRYRSAFPQSCFVPVNYGVDTPVLPAGKQEAYQGVLNNIPVAIEQDLTWEQTLEFRNDKESRRAYRDLHLWLESGLKTESERQATDLIAQKLEDYSRAIKKHGIRTTVEAISSFISLSAVVPPAAGVAAAAVNLEPTIGAVTGGVLALVGAGAWIGKRLLDLEDLKRGEHREVAYIYQIQTLVK